MIVGQNNFTGGIGKENTGGSKMGDHTDFSTCHSRQVVEKIRLSVGKSTCTRASGQALLHCLRSVLIDLCGIQDLTTFDEFAWLVKYI